MPVNSFDNYHMAWKPALGDSSGPIYLSVAAMLERDILSGDLPRGVRLPPQRELADWLDIDLTTVTRAYNVCKEKNLIYGITGRGTFVSPAPREATPEGPSTGAPADLATVASFPMISDGIADAMKRVVNEGYLDRLFTYSDTGGSPHQIAAGRRLLETNNVDASSSGIAIFAGAQNAISVALLSLFSPGDAIATDPYTYSNLIGSARLAHIKLIPVKGDAGGMRADELDRIAAKHRIKGLFIMPSTANPTGTTLSEKRKDEISSIAKARSLTVIEDDISPFPPSPQRKSFFSRLPDSTIYIAAYTAMLAPGFRITFAAFPISFRERLMKGLYLLNIKAGSLDAEVISELILSGTAQKIMAAKREAARKANDIFDATFPKFALGKNARRSELFPFFRRIKLPPSSLSGPETENFFRSRGVSVMHSCRFAVGKAIQQDFLRISISAMHTGRQLKTALGKLASALAEFPHSS